MPTLPLTRTPLQPRCCHFTTPLHAYDATILLDARVLSLLRDGASHADGVLCRALQRCAAA